MYQQQHTYQNQRTRHQIIKRLTKVDKSTWLEVLKKLVYLKGKKY
jgi:hypothetical protein